MTRATSARAHDEAEGRLPRRRQAVYEVLLRDGPSTGREVNRALGTPDGHKRLSELKVQALVVEAGERACRVTGKVAVTWRAIPEAVAKPLTVTRKAPRALVDKVRQIAADHLPEGAGRDRLVRQILGLVERPGRRASKAKQAHQLQLSMFERRL